MSFNIESQQHLLQSDAKRPIYPSMKAQLSFLLNHDDMHVNTPNHSVPSCRVTSDYNSNSHALLFSDAKGHPNTPHQPTILHQQMASTLNLHSFRSPLTTSTGETVSTSPVGVHDMHAIVQTVQTCCQHNTASRQRDLFGGDSPSEQRGVRKKRQRKFVCATCSFGFYTNSDLQKVSQS